ncbi:putative transcriptional regulator [Nocardia nova SH22a]|uniref:Putative transcriptional regulator n=1 Tax=Nocardia nova SH22a TaxID=1415166 RepID=W5TQT8_9NOCA|nr:BTAD domain-containing putative transcriptional regulator [Nocardia nova]AHH21750.1 putative transcriptional regulator [Nocardia nova SH22a]
MFSDHSGSADTSAHTRPDGRGPALSGIRVAVLGEIALRRDADLVTVPGARARLLVAALAVQPGRSRSAQALIDDVWGEQPPRAPMNALHTQVSRLRSALPEGALEIGPAGYRLLMNSDQVDLSMAQVLEREARQRLESGDSAGCLDRVLRARGLWRGEPGADLPPGPVADEVRELAAARASALDVLELSARESAGDIEGALRVARRSAAVEPLDEPAHATLMRLLATDGRANEALEVFAGLRTRLGEELGTDPGPALVALNTSILRGDQPPPRPAPASAVQRVSSAQHALTPEDRPEPTAALPNTALGLRAAPNPLLGRESDLRELEKLVGEFRVTTVLGPGGTGKTRVANELGLRLSQRLPVTLVELASLRADSEGTPAERMTVTCAEIENAIGAVLGVNEYTRDTNVLRRNPTVDGKRRLREALSLRPMVLILDNCEHLIDAVAEVVADLVGSCEQLTVVATSRAPLAITAETVYPLPPLAIDAQGSPATELFVSRARAVRPSARLDPEVVARLCRTLDGLPLAIELAAARVRAMSVEEIESRLEHRFALLRSGDRSSPERHRTLHAVIEWSWNLLEPEQRVALRRLCRFPGGFTLRAAEFVAGGPDVLDAVAAVDGLVGQSLLTVLADDDAIDTRYRMLETVREFGEEQLSEAGEADLVMDRMCGWAREFVHDAVCAYDGPEQVRVVLSFAAELDNLLSVLRHALDTGDSGTIYTIFGPIAVLWVMRGAHMELMNWAPRVVAVPSPTGARPSGAADLEMLAHVFLAMHLAFADAGLRPLAIIRVRARRLLARDDLRPALRFLAELLCAPVVLGQAVRRLAAGTRVEDEMTRSLALMIRANLRENASYMAGSTRDAKQLLALVDGRDAWGTAMCCQHLGQIASQAARYEEAVGYYRRAAELMRELRCYEESVELSSFLAISMVGTGHLAEARRELELALGIVDDGVGVDEPVTAPNQRKAAVVAGLAELDLAEGHIERGLLAFRRSLELFGWPISVAGPGPGDIIVAAAVLDAHVLNDAVREVPTLALEIVRAAEERLTQFTDLPQIGGAAGALGSYLIHTGGDSRLGAELLAIAQKAVGRQDYSSMHWSRHLAVATERVGAEVIEAGQRAISGMSRHTAAVRFLTLLPDLERLLA